MHYVFQDDLYYRVGCWARTVTTGVGLPYVDLQSIPSGDDFVVSNQSSPSNWNYLCGSGKPFSGEAAVFIGRVKIFVPLGTIAEFDDVRVEDISLLNGQWVNGVPINNANFEGWSSDSKPIGWQKEGAGALGKATYTVSGVGYSLYVNGSAGATWVSQVIEVAERRAVYRVGGWVYCPTAKGASVSLQSTNILSGFSEPLNYVSAFHPGGGLWKYIWAVGRPNELEGELFFPRIKLWVDGGTDAHFDLIFVDIVGACDENGDLL